MAARKHKRSVPPHNLPLVRQILALCEHENEMALCDKAGLSRSYISQLRQRTGSPTVFHLGCLAEALGHELVLKEKSDD